jgi:hypothetical protein
VPSPSGGGTTVSLALEEGADSGSVDDRQVGGDTGGESPQVGGIRSHGGDRGVTSLEGGDVLARGTGGAERLL